MLRYGDTDNAGRALYGGKDLIGHAQNVLVCIRVGEKGEERGEAAHPVYRCGIHCDDVGAAELSASSGETCSSTEEEHGVSPVDLFSEPVEYLLSGISHGLYLCRG